MQARKFISGILSFVSIFIYWGSSGLLGQSDDKPDQYRAIHLTMQDGLTGNLGNVMLKDVNGFLWTGSYDGELCRFDGATFKKYIPDSHKRGMIHSGQIFALVEDRLHHIWIGTHVGLSRYDMLADTFSNFVPEIDPVKINNTIIPFWSTGDQVYCFESQVRIVSYDIHSFKKTIVLDHEKLGKLFIGGVSINSIILDTASNSFWMLQEDFEHHSDATLLQISLDDGEKQNYSWPCTRNMINHRHSAEAIRLDQKRNSIWINSGDGLLEFSLTDKQFHLIEAMNERVKWKEYDRYVGMDIDRFGRIWLATKPKGILIYDPETKFLNQLFSDPVLLEQTGEHILHLYCDPDGITWTSYYLGKGIYELLPFNPLVKSYSANPGWPGSLSNGSIYTIVPASNGKMWIGTENGLNIFDTEAEKFEVMLEKDLPGIKGKAIVPIFIDTIRQKAWLRAGLPAQESRYTMNFYEMDIQTRKCRPILFRHGTIILDTFFIEPNWVRPYKTGFLVYDEKHGIFEIQGNSLFADLLIPFPASVGRFVLEEDHFIYLLGGGTFENRNGTWKRIAHPADSLRWTFMLYNPIDQTYWLAFKHEMVHYDKNFKEIKSYGQDVGYNGTIFNMQIDNGGNLWFTNILNQIGRLNTSTGIITTLTEAEGFQNQYFDFHDPGSRGSNGNIYFGASEMVNGVGGFHRIFPERYSPAVTSSVYFRSLSINHNPFLLSTNLNNLRELSLNYNQNAISLETGILDYYSRGMGQIRYKFLGANKDTAWQYGPAYSAIRYEDLSPGTYHVVVQASNVNAEFNSPEKTLVIHIAMPFWETWWFRVLAALVVAGLILGVVQIRSRNLKRQNKQLEAKVEQRTNELKESLTELKETQAQLIQREKMASLGELTAGIAHEIQNPLNFINNFSEVNAELITELKQELAEGDLNEIKSIAESIEDNEKKIIHHGKRADRIVKGMLQHSRINSGQKELTDLNPLVDECLRLSYHGLKAKDKSFQARLETNFDPSISKVNIIPEDLGRVFLNLFNNAFYAVTERSKQVNREPASHPTTPYQPTVVVTTKKTLNGVEIKIEDNGIGISEKVKDKIFQPFFTTKPTGEGTGLGLSLAYDIITKVHGGELLVDSKEGKFTSLVINLPASQ